MRARMMLCCTAGLLAIATLGVDDCLRTVTGCLEFSPGVCATDLRGLDLLPNPNDLHLPQVRVGVGPEGTVGGPVKWIGLGHFTDSTNQDHRALMVQVGGPRLVRLPYKAKVWGAPQELGTHFPELVTLATLRPGGFHDLVLVDPTDRKSPIDFPRGDFAQPTFIEVVKRPATDLAFLHASLDASKFLLIYGKSVGPNLIDLNFLSGDVADVAYTSLNFKMANQPTLQNLTEPVRAASGLLDDNDEPDGLIADMAGSMSAYLSSLRQTRALPPISPGVAPDFIDIRDLDGQAPAEAVAGSYSDKSLAIFAYDKGKQAMVARGQAPLPVRGTVQHLAIRKVGTRQQVVALCDDPTARVQLVDLELRGSELTATAAGVAVDGAQTPVDPGVAPFLVQVGELDGVAGEDVIIVGKQTGAVRAVLGTTP